MNEIETTASGSDLKDGSLRRILPKGAIFGVTAAALAAGSGGTRAAIGALGGGLAAAIYAAGYLRQHLARAAVRTQMADKQLAKGALMRLIIAAAGGAAANAAGRPVLLSYVVSFGIGFALLVLSEFPRAKRSLQASGVLATNSAPRPAPAKAVAK